MMNDWMMSFITAWLYFCVCVCLYSSLPTGGVVFWPGLLGSKRQPVRSCRLHHSKSRRALPLLEPVQRWGASCNFFFLMFSVCRYLIIIFSANLTLTQLAAPSNCTCVLNQLTRDFFLVSSHPPRPDGRWGRRHHGEHQRWCHRWTLPGHS